MNYRIEELGSFSIIGQEIELTNFRAQNIQISTVFWKRFNINLKKSYLSQSGNWIKYAFMEKHDGKLFYYCAIPQKVVVPEGFISKRINTYRYMVVEHIGSMDKIYETYEKIYKEILPNSGYMPLHNEFLHFEKYDYRFHRNSSESIIEIWIPIQGKAFLDYIPEEQ